MRVTRRLAASQIKSLPWRSKASPFDPASLRWTETLPSRSRRTMSPWPLVSSPSCGCHTGPSPAPRCCNNSGRAPGATMPESAAAADRTANIVMITTAALPWSRRTIRRSFWDLAPVGRRESRHTLGPRLGQRLSQPEKRGATCESEQDTELCHFHDLKDKDTHCEPRRAGSPFGAGLDPAVRPTEGLPKAGLIHIATAKK